MNSKVVVIGAGITGLRTAMALLEEGCSVTLIEKTNKLGGMAASFKYKDFSLDFGPHKFYTQLEGIEDDFISLVGEENLNIVEKKNSIRLLGNSLDFPVKIGQLISKIPPNKAIQIALDLMKAKISLAKPSNYEEYFIKGFGKTGYRLVFEGFAQKVWGEPKSLSVELAEKRSPAKGVFDVLKTALIKNDYNVSSKHFLYPKEGFGFLAESLGGKIKSLGGEIILGSELKEVVIKDKKVFAVKIADGNKKVRNINCDIVVSTISPDELGASIKRMPLEVKESLKHLEFRALTLAYVFLEQPRALDVQWMFFPEKEFCFNRVSEQKLFSSNTCPEGKTVLTAELTSEADDSYHNMSENKIKERVIRDLEKAEIIKKDKVYDFAIRKARKVYPLYSTG